ncbi:MAG: glycosyltransferase [Candidatus Moranbacteria bacterium]|jgi:glycosyltransferase involved in cell wall biosynthesis|nr:glycosyltransferase [Candidatus Moranbacteria bacterium]
MKESQYHKTDRPKKVALVHDFLVSYGGAERVLQTLASLYPDAPIYTLLQDESVVDRFFPGREIRTSFLQSFPAWLRSRYRALLPLYPVAIETLDLREFDLVISSSGAWSKGIVTRLHTKHIAYIHSPMRYAWEGRETYLDESLPWFIPRLLARLWLSYMRLWDSEAADRPDVLLANSEYTRDRIMKYYRQDASVIYPPVLPLSESKTVAVLSRNERRHFLVVSRLTRSKKIEPVIEAFNKLGFPLVVVGSGREEVLLRRIAGQNIEFAGKVSDARLYQYYHEARALILPSEEDFGMAAVEALASGTPVIAYEYGGIREILRVGETGEVFRSQTPEVIAEAVKRFTEKEANGGYPVEVLRHSVQRFSRANFEAGIRRVTRTEESGRDIE